VLFTQAILCHVSSLQLVNNPQHKTHPNLAQINPDVSRRIDVFPAKVSGFTTYAVRQEGMALVT